MKTFEEYNDGDKFKLSCDLFIVDDIRKDSYYSKEEIDSKITLSIKKDTIFTLDVEEGILYSECGEDFGIILHEQTKIWTPI